jgi:hypothetical protein
MEHIEKLNIDKLNNAQEDTNISIYIAAAKADPDTKENEHRIRLKNKIREVKESLLQLNFREDEADKFLQPAYDVQEDSQMLRNLWGGLAIYLNENFFDTYNVTNNWNDFSYVGDEFYLLPVIEPKINNTFFYILSINLSEVRLFKANRFNIKEIKVDEFIPKNLEEAIGFDFKDRLYQHVSAHTGNGQTFYHGHAEGEEEKKEEVKRFLQQVNNGLMKILNNKTAPLIIASVDYIHSVFKDLSGYQHLLEDNISTSQKGDSESELHEKGWEIIQKIFQEQLEEDQERYYEARNKSDMVEDIVLRTMQGRVDTLFVNKNETEWGNIDEDSFTVKVQNEHNPHSKELLNFSAMNTYLTDGKVHFVDQEDMPDENAKLCAVYRY